jgi:hypothetical protein
MGARPIGGTTLHVPGLYERIRTRELKLAFAPDPRLHFVKDDRWPMRPRWRQHRSTARPCCLRLRRCWNGSRYGSRDGS